MVECVKFGCLCDTDNCLIHYSECSAGTELDY